MYVTFFKLERKPFEISPDPQFFIRTDAHNEALAGLYYGIKAHKGLMALTGEVGTGKTLMIRCLMELLDPAQVSYAYISCTRLSSWEFLQEVAKDLGFPDGAPSKSRLLREFQSFLLRRGEKGLYTALLLDEAQLLDADVLEEVRLLTNLETTRHKLLQVILVGQPELNATLESHNLRQLKQRIALRFRLRPLSEVQTRNYIWDRLWQAGSHDPIFSLAAIRSVFIHSGGIPRLINTICDNALTSAFAAGSVGVTDTMVDEVAADLFLARGDGQETDPSSPATDGQDASAEDPWLEFLDGKKEDGDYKSVGATT